MEQAASFKAYPHIGEKVFRYMTRQEDFKNCLFVCKSWFTILDNPRFWLNKLKESNMPDDVMQKWMDLVLKLKNSNLAKTELVISLRERYFLIAVNVLIPEEISIPNVKGLFTFVPFYQTVLSYRQKMYLMEKEINFTCEICCVIFMTNENLQNHKKTSCHFDEIIANITLQEDPIHPSNPRAFYCEDCKIGFKIPRHFAKHLSSKAHYLMMMKNYGRMVCLEFESCDSCSSKYHESKAKVLICLENLGKIPQGSLAEMINIWDFLFYVTQCKLCGSWYEGSYKNHLQSYLHFCKIYTLI